ncbi:ankyrin repeat protein, partial [Baffinella frigidus]
AQADLEAKDDRGATPLHPAAREGKDLAVQALLTAGADTNAGKGRVGASLVLLQAGADTEAKDRKGDTVLHPAANEGQEALVRTLLEANAQTGAQNLEGDTPLHRAA